MEPRTANHRPIEDYALIGDMETAALVSRSGSIDWLCFPRFDSGACFAALLGTDQHGVWQLAPQGMTTEVATRRRYQPDTLILDTEWDVEGTDTDGLGSVRVTDFMTPRDGQPTLIRIVEGLSGRVSMRSMLRLRFDYGSVVPWVRRANGRISAVAGPDAVSLHSDVPAYGQDLTTYADFDISAGERVRFQLDWHPSHLDAPSPGDPDRQLASTGRFWRDWMARCTYDGPWAEPVRRSLLTLKALTFHPTGGIVAAATTSLPEDIGGVRNWDYRYCWLRDATMTLIAMMRGGYLEEASAWRSWLLRAIAGDPAELQIMYGVAGERRLTEYVADWLPGYAESAPVRIGNAAAGQLQLDVYGEVMDALAMARAGGLPMDDDAWALQRLLIEHLITVWDQPDDGIWEIRGPRRHFTHSKVMAWVAMDRAVQAVERFGRPGDAARWKAVRDRIHADVLARGYDADRNTFVQAYGHPELDAALLLLPQVGFLPPSDPRVVGTIEAVQAELGWDGFIHRYGSSTEHNEIDGLVGQESPFIACSFWMVDDLLAIGRTDEANELFERLLALRNDVGLLAEEYDPGAGRMLGNFPQAYSHIALVNSALHLAGTTPVVRRQIPSEYGITLS